MNIDSGHLVTREALECIGGPWDGQRHSSPSDRARVALPSTATGPQRVGIYQRESRGDETVYVWRGETEPIR